MMARTELRGEREEMLEAIIDPTSGAVRTRRCQRG